jgi:hypothetical protein
MVVLLENQRCIPRGKAERQGDAFRGTWGVGDAEQGGASLVRNDKKKRAKLRRCSSSSEGLA